MAQYIEEVTLSTNFRKRFWSFFSTRKLEVSETPHIRKLGFTWFKRQGKSLLLPRLLAPLLLVSSVGIAVAAAPRVRSLVASFTKPKPITQSATILSASIQSAIQDQASFEIKQEQANANLVETLNPNPAATSAIQPVIDTVQEALTIDPSRKAKIKLQIIDNRIAQLQNLLATDKSDQAANKAVQIIADIGQRSAAVVTDPRVQTDREIIKLQIEQYNRLQLILQKLEDDLPITSYLKIEDARVKYLVSGAQASLNAAPNLDAVHNIAIQEVGRLVGDDFAELKAIEILSDLESGLNPETKVKLAGLQKELAIQFEKKMLKLPQDVRERKLQNYVNYSFGNPLRQIESFEQMQNFMSDREIILGLDSLKEITLKKLENRVFEPTTQEQLNQFLEKILTSPSDLKVLTQMKLDIDGGKDETRKQKLAQMQASVVGRISQFFGKENLPKVSESTDLLDVAIISNLDAVVSNSTDLSEESKQAFRNIKTQTLASFVKNISQKDFITKSSAAYDPVSANADVRILLSSPQAIQLLQTIKDELPEGDRAKIDIALKAQSSILQEHLLLQVNDPAIFDQYSQFIADNPQVTQTIQSYVGQSFTTNLTQKKKLIDKQNLKDQQALYEKMQQIVQQIFIAPNGLEIERQLPTEVVAEINKLRQELPSRNVPKLNTPTGVTLPEIAMLPDDVSIAIVAAAKQEIKDKAESQLAKLDLTIKAKDLGVSEPTILPGNPLYSVIEAFREIPVLLTTDPIDKAEKQLLIDNERTLESAKLLEGSQSQETVNLALATLDKINQDFDLLKAHVDDLKQEAPVKVEQLVDQIIENGVARQTVLASIEAKVYGDDYVKVETSRQDVLKNGIDVLLELTNQDAQKLTDKLEQVVEKSTGSDLKDIKAVELLTEIARTQPEAVQQVLEKAQASLAQNLEAKLLAMPQEERIQVVLAYAESVPGNPIRQFEAYDTLKDDFKNPETIALVEGLKDKAVENLTERISEITDARSRQQFVDTVVGDQPQDLKIALEIEQRVAPPQTAQVTEALPIVEKIADIKAEIEQNIIDTYKNKPEELVKTDFYRSATTNSSVDVIDVKVAAELTEVLSRTPEVSPEVVTVAKQEEVKIIDTLVANISKSEFQAVNGSVTVLAAETLAPAPETIAELINLKNELPSSEQAKIDVAVALEVNLIQEHFTSQIDNPVTFQTYLAQIEENPVVAQTVAQVGGTEFSQAVKTKIQEIQTVATEESKTLETTVAAVQQEIFSSPVNNPSPVEQTLPQTVQVEIQQIKQEVPAGQIPQVTVATPEPVSAPPAEAPAPAAPEVKPPEAPPVPGL